MAFTDTERTAIAQAIVTAELSTSGEIVCVVSERRHPYVASGLTLAALLAFALPFGAAVLGVDYTAAMPWRDWGTDDPATNLRVALEGYAVIQILIFVVVAALAAWTGLGAAITPRGIKRDRVHAEALSQFRARGIGATRARTGVLIYVSMDDHIAEVVADEGIYAKVDPGYWGATVAALVDGLKLGEAGRGFVDAVGLAGAVLAEHFPPDLVDNPNELPDRLIEL